MGRERMATEDVAERSAAALPVTLREAVDGADAGDGETPRRLLAAAARLFADQGYAATSVRQITAAAGCNVASVNYHFGSKAALYQAVFERMIDELRTQRIEAVERTVDQAASQRDLEPLLRAFAEAFIRPLTDAPRGEVMVRLFMREMTDPKLPAGTFERRMIQPVREAMIAAMRKVEPAFDEADALLSLHSLVAQLVHVVQLRRVLGTGSAAEAPMMDVDRAVDHIIRFSAAGVRAVAGSERD